MDDKKFDNVLRNKLQNYHHPSIHPGALDALHQQNSVKTSDRWHQHHRQELLTGSVIALGIIIFLIGYLLFIRTTRLIEDQEDTINDQRAQINSLQREVSVLQLARPDTIRIIQQHDGQSYALTTQLMRRIAKFEDENLELLEANKDRERRLFLSSNYARRFDILTDYSRIELPTREDEQPETYELKKEPKDQSTNKSMSAGTLRAIEEHYRRGVGIKLGPTVDIFGGDYSLGKGHINLSGGVLADFIISPSLGIETGLRYSERYYAVRDDDALSGSNLPGTDSQLGELQGAEVDYRALEIPFHLKYRYPLSLKNHWIAGIGYSCLIYLNQDFEYTYEFDNQSSNPTSIVSTVTSDRLKIYPGTINFSLGMSHVLKNKKIIEASLFYNHGIGTQGLEATRAQYFGVRGTYWFRVR